MSTASLLLCSAVQCTQYLPRCSVLQFASKLCNPLLLLPRLEACPVFQATSGHPGKPLAIRAGAKVWPSRPSRPSSDLLANLRQQPARQKLGPTHCPLAQSPLSGSSAECRIIIEYQNALSPECFFLVRYNCSHLCRHLAAVHSQCGDSAFQKVPQTWFPIKFLHVRCLHPKYSTVKEKYCKFVATVKI